MRVPPQAAAILRNVLPVERLVHVSPQVCAGEFRCDPTHPSFAGGCCSGHTIVFPRTPVWIRHEGGHRRLIDPTLITFYNQDQSYERWAAEGPDRCDWLAFPEETVREAVALFDPRAAESPSGPFRDGVGPSDLPLYFEQRRLFASLRRGNADVATVQEAALHLLRAALARQHAARHAVSQPAAPARRTRDAVERVREILARDPGLPPRLESLAADVELSVFYLCHAFRQVTGMTMTEYRNRLRLALSLERLGTGSDLTDVAFDLGFSSHSHFTYAFRRAFGVTPSQARGTAIA